MFHECQWLLFDSEGTTTSKYVLWFSIWLCLSLYSAASGIRCVRLVSIKHFFNVLDTTSKSLGTVQKWEKNNTSVQFSHSVVSDSLRPHESQHTRPPCPSPTPGVYSNSCPSSRRCHPAISSSFIPFSSCPQSLPASGSFPASQLFASGGQSTGVSASA